MSDANGSGKVDEMKALWEAARERAKVEKTPEAREAAIAAWAALEAATPRRKGGGQSRCNQAGKRQAAERRAEQAERDARRSR
jgi:hypothetical protein